MFEIKVSQEIKNACPVFAGAAVYAAVKNTAYCDGLWKPGCCASWSTPTCIR